ncbi:hypothetical protein EJ110_NYTH35720 [Nymphaea thermarum]|nr:hypothetical protein EJ110_NYTH35720 [Nymphaea thermarum]
MAPSSSHRLSYPYPLNLNVANFVSLKLTHNNFLLWKMQILALIESQDMEGFLTGSIAAPPSHIVDHVDPHQLISNPSFESWRRSDRLIRGWITGTLSETVLGLVVGLNYSQEIWSTLIDAFAQESQERGFHLTHMLTTCKKGNDALEVYVAKFKAICDDLAAIGKSVGDKEKAFWLLQGLGKGYEPFVMAMLKPPVPSYKELISLLQSLEVRNKFLNLKFHPKLPTMHNVTIQIGPGALIKCPVDEDGTIEVDVEEVSINIIPLVELEKEEPSKLGNAAMKLKTSCEQIWTFSVYMHDADQKANVHSHIPNYGMNILFCTYKMK